MRIQFFTLLGLLSIALSISCGSSNENIIKAPKIYNGGEGTSSTEGAVRVKFNRNGCSQCEEVEVKLDREDRRSLSRNGSETVFSYLQPGRRTLVVTIYIRENNPSFGYTFGSGGTSFTTYTPFNSYSRDRRQTFDRTLDVEAGKTAYVEITADRFGY